MRSRCFSLGFAPLRTAALAELLQRQGFDAAESFQRAALAEGRPGRAMDLDLEALRERRSDILPLARYFLALHGPREGKLGCHLSLATSHLLEGYAWPGNVRELENEILRTLMLTPSGELITPRSLSPKLTEILEPIAQGFFEALAARVIELLCGELVGEKLKRGRIGVVGQILGPVPERLARVVVVIGQAAQVLRLDGGQAQVEKPGADLFGLMTPAKYGGSELGLGALISTTARIAQSCGSTAWVNCSGCSKLIQKEKLRQARETGARVMLTTCPKCQIHLSCASRDLDADQAVEVEDLISWVGRALA